MTDLLVAGGGPIGLATAIRARLAGLEVAVVEPRAVPVDKACGEGLMPAAVSRLAELGVHPAGFPFRGIAYVRNGTRVAADFRAGPGLGVRRTALQAALAARAEAVGVRMVAGRVSDVRLTADGVGVDGHQARWLVAADGLHSEVRRMLGLAVPAGGPARFGLRRHFALAPWDDHVEVHWSDDAEAYVTPVAPDVVGVALLCTAQAHRRGYDATLAGFPALAQRLAGAPAVTPVRGAGPLRQRARVPNLGRVLLVGDAAGYVDALTGEGLAIGLATARAAVDCVLADDPTAYAARWRAATRTYRLLTGSLLVAANRPALRRAIVPAAARLPRVFGAAVDALA